MSFVTTSTIRSVGTERMLYIFWTSGPHRREPTQIDGFDRPSECSVIGFGGGVGVRGMKEIKLSRMTTAR
jgi:hypothetical protein